MRTHISHTDVYTVVVGVGVGVGVVVVGLVLAVLINVDVAGCTRNCSCASIISTIHAADLRLGSRDSSRGTLSSSPSTCTGCVCRS